MTLGPSLSPTLAVAIARALGSGVSEASRVGGGDINEAFAVALTDGRRAFVKSNRRAAPDMFEAEAHGLAWLAEANAIRIPRVLAVGSGASPFLVLELIEPARSTVRAFDEHLGRGLANLHRSGAPGFGLDRSNYIGSLPQSNRAHGSWAEFYRSERLAPMIARAFDRGDVPAALRSKLDLVLERMEALVGPNEPPSRLHGDLWGGNLHRDCDGEPVLIDPAVYGGHREIDLAMMRLFGGFSERVFDAYAEAFPLADGASDRVPLYQLYPLLVHVNLFGSSYSGGVARAVDAIL
jgi:fructosamine-3-kinase